MESWAVVPDSRPAPAPPGHIFLIMHTLPCVLHVTAWWALLLAPLIHVESPGS